MAAHDEETPDEQIQPQAGADARIPSAHAVTERTQDAQPPSTERTLAAHPSLKRTDAFLAVYRRGRWAKGPSLSVGALPADGQGIRVGLRTRRGLKGAATRNRLKRQLRAILSTDRLQFRHGLDVVIVIHPTRIPVRTSSLERELLALCRRIGATV